MRALHQKPSKQRPEPHFELRGFLTSPSAALQVLPCRGEDPFRNLSPAHDTYSPAARSTSKPPHYSGFVEKYKEQGTISEQATSWSKGI